MVLPMSCPTFPNSFEIAGRLVGGGAPCLVIAEAGVAHFGDLNKALRLVDLAVDARADVFKTQHFHTNLLIGPGAPEWRERMQSKELGDEDIARVHSYAIERGISFLCTAHDEAALDFVDRELNVSAFKVGSGEVENWPYLENVARRGKPIILSTGMYTLDQVQMAAKVIWDAGGRELALLHCVTSYPTPPAQVNLDAIRQIRMVFSGPVGYSDHTVGTVVPLAAVALGASIIEKHITLDVNVPNAHDWKVSCTAETLAPFVGAIRDIEAAIGGWTKRPAAAEETALSWARKSITAAIDLDAGHVLTVADVLFQRPGSGLPPSQLPAVVGRSVRSRILAGTPITADMLDI